MKNLRIRVKLILGFATVSALTLIIGIAGIVCVNYVDYAFSYAIVLHQKPLVKMGYALIDLQATRFEARGVVIYADQPDVLQEIEDSIYMKFERFEMLTDEYQKTIIRDDARKLYNEAMQIYMETYKPALLKLLADVKQGVGQDELIQILRNIKHDSDIMSNALTAALNIKDSMVDRVSNACTAQTRIISVVFTVLLAITVMVSVILGLSIAQHINTPLLTLAAFMRKASTTGDLVCTPEEQQNIVMCTRKDEIGQTITSCAKFIQRSTDVCDVMRAVADGDFNATVPLLSDRDVMGQSLKKMTNGLNFMMNRIESLLVQAQSASRAKSEFMSRMSHEMLTPMNAIIALNHFVRQFNLPDQGKEYLDMMDSASNQLLRLIRDVLDTSNMESGDAKLEYSAFSLSAVLDDVLKTVNPMIKEKNQTFTYHIDSSIPPSVQGDKNRLERVISSLLNNAVKFTPAQGKIRFDANVLGKDGGNIILQMEIADNGIGISQDQQKVLFDIFEQVDGGNARKYGGVGLGLVLARRIIEAMGGKIWVESELGKGTKFIFTCTVHETE